jgi:hypothetical protein
MLLSFPFRRATLLLVTVALVSSGCQRGAEDGSPGFLLADSAGVALATNAGPDRPLVPGGSESFRLGGRDAPPEDFHQVGSWNVGVDDAGRIHVMDHERHQVHRFDATGRHLVSLGGTGGGPGELRIPLLLAVSPQGEVRVPDLSKGAIVRWGPEGAVLEQLPFPEGYVGGRMAWGESGAVFHLRGADGERLVLRPGEPDSVTLATSPRPQGRDLHFASCGLGLSNFPRLFTPSMSWASQGDVVAVINTGVYQVDLFDQGRRVRSIRREVPPRPVTREMALASLGEGMRVRTAEGELLCDPSEVVDAQGYEPFLPILSEVALAPDGTLWVRRYALGDETAQVDVFDAEGRYLGTVADSALFPVAFLPDGRILAAEEDALGVQRLVVRSVAFEKH